MKTIKILFILALTSFFTTEVFAQKSNSRFQEVAIKTSIQCGHCKERVSEALTYTKGVLALDVDVDTKMVTVKYNTKKTSPEALCKAIADVGYDANEVAANGEAYAELPNCCKKDGEACGGEGKHKEKH